jgi:AAA15 family ATPase/GTPase
MTRVISGYDNAYYEIIHAFGLGISIMLLDYTVENYKSIKEPVTLSAIAATKPHDTEKAHGRYASDDKVGMPIPVADRGFALVPVIGILGANASGKSNIIKSLDGLLSFVHPGVSRGDTSRNLSFAMPHLLDQNYWSKPTGFILRAAVDAWLYEYTLVMDPNTINHELLRFMRPGASRWTRFFDRTWNPEQGAHTWYNHSEHAARYSVLQPNLGQATPYLRLLMSSFRIDLIRPLAGWIEQRWPGSEPSPEPDDPSMSVAILGSDSSGVIDRVSRIVRQYDTGISALNVTKTPASKSSNGKSTFEIEVQHATTTGSIASWPIEFESLGTQRLFVLLTQVIEALDDGTTLLIDELGSNIHPNITRDIVRWFQNPKINTNHAQLIFTTHDANLTRRTTLRRDEVWFTEKRADGSTRLFPLTDFKPRNDLLIERSYLDGRFGGVPITPSEDELIAEGLLTVRGGTG